MTQEDKRLLLIDLCARLPYDVKVCYQGNSYDVLGIDRGRISINIIRIGEWLPSVYTFDVKPYLRPMSSMTKEEYEELKSISSYYGFAPYEYIGDWCPNYEMVNWLNAHHFDYRGLIKKGLALEAPKEIYN